MMKHGKEIRRAKDAVLAAGLIEKKRKLNIKRIISVSVVFVLFFTAFGIDRGVMPLRYLQMAMIQPNIPEREADSLRVHFLDVGQGDCTILEFPDGKTMLVDGGDGSETNVRKVISYCFALNIQRFDWIVLTHIHRDHVGGLKDVLRCFGANEIYMPYCPDREVNGEFFEFVQQTEKEESDIRITHLYHAFLAEQSSQLCYGMILSPFSKEIENSEYNDEDYPYDAQAVNDTSAVLYVEYAGRTLLMTGDASVRVEEKIVSAFKATDGIVFERDVQTSSGKVTLSPQLEQLDFLKAGHHGSSTSTGHVLAEYCKPKEIFFSNGVGNSYSQPNLKPMYTILKSSPDSEFYRTDELGNIILTVHADGEYSISYNQ